MITMPIDVQHILNTLNKNNFQAYIVGGCVRDSLMNKSPKDWDITTDALPSNVKSLFNKSFDTGLKHGTITVLLNHQNYEITTFRADGEYLDNRRPESVAFTTSLEDDLSRRDFTMNAIAYNPQVGIVDPFNGILDIENRQIKCVGNANTRFNEDALRMLRAIRFSAQLDFNFDDSTYLAIKDNTSLIKFISQERINEELTKILISDNPLKFNFLNETGLLQFIIPEFDKCFNLPQNNPHHIYNVAMHSLHAVNSIPNKPELRWTMLLHDIGKTNTKTTDNIGVDHFYGHMQESVKLSKIILDRLKFDNKSKFTICKLIRFHDRPIEPNHKALRKAIVDIGDEYFLDLMEVKLADKKAQNPVYLDSGIEYLDTIKTIYTDIKQKNQCLSLKDLEINGLDLINLGFKQDKSLSIALNKLLNLVIESPEINEKNTLLQLSKTWLRDKSPKE